MEVSCVTLLTLAVIVISCILDNFATDARVHEYMSVGKETKIVEANHRNKRAAIKDNDKKVLTFEDRKLFLDKHNELRSAVSPSASNMKKLVSICFLWLEFLAMKKLMSPFSSQ